MRSDPGEFKAKVRTIANKIQCNPHHLMAVMAFETGRTFSPSVRNPRGSATGLIQFISSTANALGTTTTKLAAMTAVEQLDVVEAYFKMQARGRRFERLSDLYMAVLFPVAIPKPDGAALFKRGTRNYSSNAGLDINNDGIVTKGEAAAKVRQQLERGLRPENRG
ncbi:MAG: lytic transglycosylase [Rhizobiales bacterium]|nr:lytic transglycosylase [Hyphomicrobiales bacterium]